MIFVAAGQCQWLNNFGYGLNPAGYFGGYYPANSIQHTGYPGFPASAGAFYGQPGRFVNYPAASLPSYDAFGNQVGGYGQLQDTPEVAQAKADHFAAHAAARAHLIAPVAATPVVMATAPAEPVVAATPISRRKRQISLSQSSPFAYGFSSPFVNYNNFGTPFGYNSGAPFGYPYANPLTYTNQYYPYSAANGFAFWWL